MTIRILDDLILIHIVWRMLNEVWYPKALAAGVLYRRLGQGSEEPRCSFEPLNATARDTPASVIRRSAWYAWYTPPLLLEDLSSLEWLYLYGEPGKISRIPSLAEIYKVDPLPVSALSPATWRAVLAFEVSASGRNPMAILMPPYSEFLQDQAAVDTLCHLYDTSLSELARSYAWWQCYLNKAGSTFEKVVTRDILCHLPADLERQMRRSGMDTHHVQSIVGDVRQHIHQITGRLKQASKQTRLLYYLPQRLKEKCGELATQARRQEWLPLPSQPSLVPAM
jgi:hypothetical protein